jgi:hypothetical protein
MQTGKWKIVLLLLFCVALAFEVWHLRGGGTAERPQTRRVAAKRAPNFALLPAAEIATYADHFADSKPRMENWEPTVGDINDLEAALSLIAALSNKEQDIDRHIVQPDQYFRQYLAVVVNGKKIIFVNAMCSIKPDEDWRKHLIIAMGGGKCFWNAIYDPMTQTFSNLVVNGRA